MHAALSIKSALKPIGTPYHHFVACLCNDRNGVAAEAYDGTRHQGRLNIFCEWAPPNADSETV